MRMHETFFGKKYKKVLDQFRLDPIYNAELDFNYCTVFQNSYMRLAVVYQRGWGEWYLPATNHAPLDIKSILQRESGWCLHSEYIDLTDPEYVAFRKKHAASDRIPKEKQDEFNSQLIRRICEAVLEDKIKLGQPRFKLEEYSEYK